MFKYLKYAATLLLFPIVGFSQIPPGYYNGTAGLTGVTLKNKLHDIISANTNALSYSDLWTAYSTTDKKGNGKVWDMYSDVPGGTPPYSFTFSTDQCGGYSGEADCYNREHSIPASWFNDDAPMYTDLFHVVPTDGYVNNKRSNYPFGEVGSASWTSQNGSKLGSNVFAGFSGTVFEPIDSFKGDFARIYFYMATRYKDEIPSWSSASFSGTDLSTWSKNLFLEWNALDPVSAKEIARNNNVYSLQNNRNPYVDNPQWVNDVWGYPLTINENQLFSNVKIYPNPTSDEINITLEINDIQSITILSLEGKKVYQSFSNLNTQKIDIRFLQNGLYFLNVNTNVGIFVEKIVIVR